jgi:hypothetical protein
MGSNYFLNNINRTIGENMRFARQFQANQQAASSQGAGTAGSADPNSPNAILLMLLFQLFSQMMAQGQPTTGNSPAPPGVAGADPYYNTGLPVQNPAYQFLSSIFTAAQPESLNFEDNISIQGRMDQILSATNNAVLFDLANQLKTISPTSPEAQQLHTRIKAQFQLEGRSNADIQAYDLLWQAAQINHTLQEEEIVATGNPSQEATERMAQLKQQRATLAIQWNQGFSMPGTTEGGGLAAKAREALQKGQFSETQLGQTLKYLLDKGPARVVNRVVSLISNLMETGELNITPFLNNDYLERLTPERREALLHAVESSGLRMADGRPNSRFIGFMLDQLGRPGTSATKTFLRQFLQDFYIVHGNKPNTPVGQTLADILRLAGIQAGENQQLLFN